MLEIDTTAAAVHESARGYRTRVLSGYEECTTRERAPSRYPRASPGTSPRLLRRLAGSNTRGPSPSPTSAQSPSARRTSAARSSTPRSCKGLKGLAMPSTLRDQHSQATHKPKCGFSVFVVLSDFSAGFFMTAGYRYRALHTHTHTRYVPIRIDPPKAVPCDLINCFF